VVRTSSKLTVNCAKTRALGVAPADLRQTATQKQDPRNATSREAASQDPTTKPACRPPTPCL